MRQLCSVNYMWLSWNLCSTSWVEPKCKVVLKINRIDWMRFLLGLVEPNFNVESIFSKQWKRSHWSKLVLHQIHPIWTQTWFIGLHNRTGFLLHQVYQYFQNCTIHCIRLIKISNSLIRYSISETFDMEHTITYRIKRWINYIGWDNYSIWNYGSIKWFFHSSL